MGGWADDVIAWAQMKGLLACLCVADNLNEPIVKESFGNGYFFATDRLAQGDDQWNGAANVVASGCHFAALKDYLYVRSEKWAVNICRVSSCPCLCFGEVWRIGVNAYWLGSIEVCVIAILHL